MINPETLKGIIAKLESAVSDQDDWGQLANDSNPIWNDENVDTLTDEDEWYSVRCYGVDITINAHLAFDDGSVSFVLYVRPVDATFGSSDVADDEWCQMVIRAPFDMAVANANPDHIIEAIQNRKK